MIITSMTARGEEAADMVEVEGEVETAGMSTIPTLGMPGMEEEEVEVEDTGPMVEAVPV